MVTQFAIEPHAFMAAPDGDGIAVWSSIQHPYWLQRVIADAARPAAREGPRLRARPGRRRSAASSTPSTSRCSRSWRSRPGRPVRLVLTLEETFQAVRRGASEIRVRSGFRRDGTLVFRDIEANYLIGAYADIADRTVAQGQLHRRTGRTACPAVRIVARSVLSHTVPSTAFRGFGNPQQIWAVESNMDEAARELGIDPLELRLRNLAGPGDAVHPAATRRPTATGPQAVAAGGRADRLGRSPTPPGRGRGIAVGLKSGPTTGLSYSTVRLLADGSVVVYAGTSDMGQGARTIFAQIAARGAGRAARLGDGRHGRHGRRAVRPADLGQPLVGADGQRDPAGLRDIQAKLRDRLGADYDDSARGRGQVRAALGRLGGEIIGLGEARKEADPDHPLGGSARSSSSTARPSS